MNKIKFIFILALLIRVVLAFGSWHPDLNNHVDWGERFYQYGPSKFYAPESNVWDFTWPNQPPGTILIFAGIRKLFELIFNIFWKINTSIPAFPSIIITFFEDMLYLALLKLPSILADIGIGYLIYKFLKQHKNPKVALVGATMFLFNPLILYNSAVWGQTDSVINFLALLGFSFLFNKKLFFAVFALIFSLYIKISLFIFIPIFLIVVWKQKYKFSNLVFSFLIPILGIGAVTLLFSDGHEPYSWLLTLYQEKVLTNQLQVITANAFNIWATLTGIHEQPHTLLWGPLMYRDWGYILFGLSFIPLLYSVWKDQKPEKVIWVLALTAFSSWMFLTNMHERYLYPLFPYFTILASIYPNLRPVYWLTSGISLLNLYNFWFTPRIEPIVQFISFGNRLMPRVLGAINLVILGFLYKFWYNTSNRK